MTDTNASVHKTFHEKLDTLKEGLVALSQRAEEVLDRLLAILGMNSVDPILVGLVGRVGRQPVDDEVFRGTAVLEAVAEVDLDATDTADALDPGEFCLAFLQRAMSPIAFMCDLFEMLAQPFCGGCFGKCVGTIGCRHTCPQTSCGTLT